MQRSMKLRFTEQPVRHTASAVQSIYQVVDLMGEYRVLDLMLSTYVLTGTTAESTVRIETSMQATDDDGWVTLGSFAKETAANRYQLASLSNALRFVRYGVLLTGSSPTVVFDISGYARAKR